MFEALPPTLSYTPCLRVRAGVACPATHRIAAQAAVTWGDLSGERVIVVPGDPRGYNTFVRTHLEAEGAVVEEVEGPRVSSSMLAAHIADGRLGLHVCPRFVHDPLPPDLAWVPFDPPARIEFGVAWRRNDDRESLRRFVRWMSATARH